jgi:extracellular elastinolytic metalloproteinase
MRTFLRLSLFGLAGASLLASCTADVSILSETTAPNGAKIIRGDGPLTPPSSEPRDRIIRDYLKTRGAGSAVDQLRVVRETSPYNGIVHVTMEQVVDGLRVYDAYAKAAIDSQGQLIQIIDNVVRPQAQTHRPGMTAADALALAYVELGFTMSSTELGQSGAKTFFEPGTDFFREPSAELVMYVDAKGTLHQGYLVETWYRSDNQLEETLVGTDGSIVSHLSRTSLDSYNVFRVDPIASTQQSVSGPTPVATPGTVPSPAGWLGSGTQSSWAINGNNASAYLDTDNNNAADAGGTAVTNGVFGTVFSSSTSPSTDSNKNVAVQNLFFLNNYVHDALYAAGFNEAAGNFQIDNFGRGGAAGDPVNAEAQDGGGVDNANFSTPSDGSRPRMQMYLWTPAGGNSEVVVGSANYAAAAAGFGPALSLTGVSAPLAVASVADGCTAFTGVTGAIAVIDRGSCDFTVKVLNAQNAGAVGAIVANNAGDGVFTMGGTNRRINIPSVMVGQTDGGALKTAAGQSAIIRKDNTPIPQLDGDLDSDIVFHEYGHGLTWRMVGNMSGAVSGAIGEGASDTVSFMLNGDDRVGEYSFSDPVNGIRRHRYEGYDKTYKDWCGGGCEVHNDGEIYGAAMWSFRKRALALGLSSSQALSVWVQSLNRAPSGPSVENMRDALGAEAASTSHALYCAAHAAFAEFGIGAGSSLRTKGTRSATVVESFALPSDCP